MHRASRFLLALVCVLAACARYEPAPVQPGCSAEPRPPLRPDTGTAGPLAAGALAGRVEGLADGRAPGAMLRVELTAAGPAGGEAPPPVAVDSLGRWRVAGLAPGAYAVRVRALGYPPRTDTFVVGAAPGRAVVQRLAWWSCPDNFVVLRRKPWWKWW